VFTRNGIYDVTISEGVPVLAAIVNVSATDQDTGRNGQVFYDMVNSDVAQIFGIRTMTGEIFPRVSLLEVSENLYQV